jgi:hypothetical protein
MEDKLKKTKLALWIVFVVGLIAFGQPGIASAGPISVSIDTSSLEGQGTFTLAFVLNDGSGAGDANTTVTINDFMFGATGTATTDPTTVVGGATGDLFSAVSLIDNSFFNVFEGNFVAGSLLSFQVAIASTSVDTPTPDFFEAVILDSTGTPVATTDPSGNDFVFSANLSSTPEINTYAIATPEPSVFVFLLSGFLLGVLILRRN